MANYGINFYKGKDFEGFKSCQIEVKDDLENSAYSIRFVDENVWHDNIDDDDILFTYRGMSNHPSYRSPHAISPLVMGMDCFCKTNDIVLDCPHCGSDDFVWSWSSGDYTCHKCGEEGNFTR